jgi:hypothetical protein
VGPPLKIQQKNSEGVGRVISISFMNSPGPCERNAAISRHFERDPILYALETDWPVGAGGFEPVLPENQIRT